MKTISFSEDQLRWLRMRAQGLAGEDSGSRSVAQVVREAGGLQAQEAPAAALGIRARSRGVIAADVERARLEGRSIVRTWGMRGTLHLLAVEDLGWIQALFKPLPASRRRNQQLGLDEAGIELGVGTIRAALAERGPLTRAGLAQELATAGLPGEGQGPYHLIQRAALAGLICQGPDQAGEPAYVLLEDWLGKIERQPPERARAALARRYLAAYGPAGERDLAAWSGLPVGEARRALEAIGGELTRVEAAGSPAWALSDRLEAQLDWLETKPAGPAVRLLPKFDHFLLGWADRALILAPKHARRIHPGGGILHPAVLVDGRVAARWRTKKSRAVLAVAVEPFEPLAAEALPGLEAEVEDVGRFLGVEARLEI
jgi:hypothetical protein